MTYHNSMLINSGVHTWGYSSFEDAMSGDCTAKNLPMLFPFMLGEQNHNNHHASPTAISTWQYWYEFDVWGIVIRGLQCTGLVDSFSTFRRKHEADSFHMQQLVEGDIWFAASLQSLMIFPVLGIFTQLCKAWRQTKHFQSVTAVVVALALFVAIVSINFVLSDPALSLHEEDDPGLPFFLSLFGSWTTTFAEVFQDKTSSLLVVARMIGIYMMFITSALSAAISWMIAHTCGFCIVIGMIELLLQRRCSLGAQCSK